MPAVRTDPPPLRMVGQRQRDGGFSERLAPYGKQNQLRRIGAELEFAQEHRLGKAAAEWCCGVLADYSPMQKSDKIGFWKCPYHNSRACLEVMARLGKG